MVIRFHTDISDGITSSFSPPAASELITDLTVGDSINQANWYVQNHLQPWTKTHLQFQIRMFGESLPPDEADADSRPDDPSAGERL